MSDALEHEVKIIINVVSDLRQSQRELDAYSESVGSLPRKAQQAVDGLGKLADKLESVAGSSKQAANGSRSLIDILTLEERKAGDAARQWELYAKALSNAGRSRWSDQNASNANNWTTARPGSVFDQGQRFDGSSATRASDTTWARDAQERSKAAIAALRAHDAALNSNAVAYRASTGAIAQNAAAFDEWAAALPRQRYALYDVAFATGVVTTAITGLGVAVLGTSSSFESAFTNVERTLEPGAMSVQALRDQLMGLTRDIPLSFQEISQIATLGNQLGVEAQSIEGFTGTVARFSAVAGVSAEETAKSFGSMGEIMNVLPDQYENLGSAIALVGRRSVATEQEILSLTREIGQQANSAGFTADQVVGLAGALGELRVPPERARGSLTTYFQTLNKAVAEGGEKLDAFAQIIGVTGSQLEQMVRGNEGPEIMRRFLAALSDLDNVDTTKALDDLGLAQLRVSDVFQRLSSNVNVFNENLASGAEGWTSGTELARQYGMVLDDLESKWKIFLNAVAEVGAAVGDTLAPAIKAALDAVTPLLHNLAAFAESPFGQWVIKAAAAIGVLVAAIAGAVTTFAIARGALLAIQTALATTSWAGATTGIAGFASGMLGMSTATGAAAVALNVFKIALISTGIGAAIVLLGSLTGAFLTAGQAAEQSFQSFVGGTAGLNEALAADAAAYHQAIADGNQALADSFAVITPSVRENTAAQDENQQAIANTAAVLGMAAPGYDDANAAIYANTQYLGENTIAWLKNQLMQSEAFRNMAGNQEFTDYWTTIGANMEDVIRASATGGEAAVNEYFMRLEAAAIAGGARFRSAFENGYLASGWMGGGDGIGRGKGLFGNAMGKGINDISNMLSGFSGQLTLMGIAGTSASKNLGGGFDDASVKADKLAKSIGGGGGGGRGGGGGGGVTKKVRTLVDYANDLSSVMKRAFDFRFGGEQALDKITSGWQKVRDAAEAARDAAAEHQQKLAEMGADRQIKQYWLMVAENYGDELRAAKIREELAKLDGDMSKEKKDLSKEQDKASMSLVGNSEAAIENRSTVLGMVSSYQDYLNSLAASGMSQKDLQAKSVQLRAEFVQQATQLGFSRAEVEKYAKSFDDMATIIQKVPRNVTVNVNANTDPAMAAIREFEARAQGLAGRTYGGGTISMPNVANGSNASKAARQALLISEAANLTTGAAISQIPYAYRKARLEEIERLLRTGNYWTGGYVGDGGKYEPKGIVHGGEFVFSKAATSFLGRNNLAYMHSMAKAGVAVGPAGGAPTGGMVELSPFDRSLLMEIAAAARASGFPGSGVIQAVVNGSNANFAQRRGA